MKLAASNASHLVVCDWSLWAFVNALAITQITSSPPWPLQASYSPKLPVRPMRQRIGWTVFHCVVSLDILMIPEVCEGLQVLPLDDQGNLLDELLGLALV